MTEKRALEIDRLLEDLARSAGIRVERSSLSPVGGGSIHGAYRAVTERGPIFLKLNDRSALPMFEAEAAGLVLLAGAEALRVPAVLGSGQTGTLSYLALEWLDLGARTPRAERALGRGLARQHRVTGPSFGLDRDNTIGATPQVNTPTESWLEFFREMRLRPQLVLAEHRGLPARLLRQARELMARLDVLLGAHHPPASLLHGDLWGGNWGATPEAQAAVFDPAVYFGDREADLAMTRLFGGFGTDFYAAYESEWALPSGWDRRADLYNLYHLLNHFNLFGGGYAGQVRASVERLMRVTQ